MTNKIMELADAYAGYVYGSYSAKSARTVLEAEVSRVEAELAAAHGAAQAKPLTEKDVRFAIDKLAYLFDMYENGTSCYEYPDDFDGYIGNAFIVPEDAFQEIAEFLNRIDPIEAAHGIKEQS